MGRLVVVRVVVMGGRLGRGMGRQGEMACVAVEGASVPARFKSPWSGI